MKNTIRKFKDSVRRIARACYVKSLWLSRRFRLIMASDAGDGYVDVAIKILIAVVLGALLLGGLYALFGDTIMPTVTRKIEGMFNYAG